MRSKPSVLLGLTLVALLSPAVSGGEIDFSKINRTILKQPKYVAQPLYALFLMDAKGSSHHWAVLDKSKIDLPYYDVLYFDLTGTGDLTLPSNRFVGKYDKKLEPAGMGLTIRVGDVHVPGTDLVHKNFLISTTPKSNWKGIWFRMNWAGKTEMSGGYNRVGFDTTQYARTPETAPVLWPCPHARLSFGVWGERPLLAMGQPTQVNFIVGNCGSGPDTLCVVDEHFLMPEKDHLFATLIAKDSNGREVRHRTPIQRHC